MKLRPGELLRSPSGEQCRTNPTLEANNTIGTHWTLDPGHSAVGFSVRHLMITNVRGEFATFRGTISRIVCAKDEAAGRLVRVLPTFAAKGADLCVLYPPAAHVPARVAAFRDFVAAAFAAMPAARRAERPIVSTWPKARACRSDQ